MMRPALAVVFLLAAAACVTAPARPPNASAPSTLRKQLARSLLNRHEWATASRPLLEEARLNPGDPEVHVLLAAVYREQGLYEESMTEYATALTLAPQSAEAYAGRGILRDVQGQFGEEALADFGRAIALEPRNPAHYNNLGFALYLRGRTIESVVALRQSLREDPAGRRAHNNLGFAYGQLGHYSRARREFERGGGTATVENNLGVVLEETSPREACDYFQTAAARDPKLEAPRTNIARACSSSTSPKGSPP